jgi:oligopeptide/dipeptide ABC transporter ATP-binding protein
MARAAAKPLLTVNSLNVILGLGDGRNVTPVRDVSFDIMPGETLGVVGESGSGKSTLALALTRMSAHSTEARITGRVLFEGSNLLDSSPAQLRRIRGGRVGYIFQSPDAALNPTQTIGSQITSVLLAHQRLSRRAAQAEAIALLESVGIREPAKAVRRYPHQFSGGMKQRAVIAVAIANRPSLLIADEPTSALDVLVQERIIELLIGLRERFNMAMIFVSHDFRVVSRLASRILVLDAGRIAEIGPTHSVLTDPKHRYTEALLRAVPRINITGTAAKLATIRGQPAMDAEVLVGCPFASRCDHASETCRRERPQLVGLTLEPSHLYACWHPSGDHV